jgi:branched-chain amino acid transport system substrate-binding protein
MSQSVKRLFEWRAHHLLPLAAVIAVAIYTSIFAYSILKKPAAAIQIAVVMPLTGAEAREGMMMVNAVRLCFSAVNRAGGIHGHPVEIKTFDDKGDADVAVQKAKEIAASPAIAVVGHFTSATSVAAAPIYKAAHLPAITATASAPAVTAGNPFYFRVTIDSSVQGHTLAAYARQVMRKGKASVLYSDEDYGRSLFAAFEDEFAEQEGGVRYKWAWKPKGSAEEHAAMIRRMAQDIINGDAGVVILAISPYSAAKDALCLLRRTGANPVILGGSALGEQFPEYFRDEPEEKRQPGFFTNNTYIASPIIFDSATNRGLAFIEQYQSMYNQKPASGAAKHYEAALLIAEALRKGGLALTPQTRDADRQRLRDWLGAQDNAAQAIQGLTGPLYFEDNQTLPQTVRIGRGVEGRCVSAPVQLEEIPNPDLIDLDREMAANRVIRIRQSFYWLQQVVYTGIEINQIERIDPSRSTFTADFYLWFRYAGDDEVRDVDLNAASEKSPYDPNAPLMTRKINGLHYCLYRVRGEFKASFDFHDYPFDEQSLVLQLSNPRLTREQVIYAIDTFGLRLPRPGGGASELSPLENWHFTQIRYLPDTLRSSSTRGHPGAFHGGYETQFSGFDVVIGAKRFAFVFLIKTLLPLVLLVLVVYVTLFFPVSLITERLTIAVSALLASAVLLAAINSQLTDVGYTTAIEIGFYVFFALCLLCVISGLIAERLQGADHTIFAHRSEIFARIAYPLAVIAVFAAYYFRYH